MFGGKHRDVYRIYGSHPNDAGFLCKADVIGRQVEIIFKRD